MKKYYLLPTILLLLISSWAHSQHQNDPDLTILKAPKKWKKELMKLPLSFAPSIDYHGFEDIRFSEGWSDSTSQDFWGYVFVWYLDNDPLLSEEKLESDMKAYYNGLMKTKNTLALFLKKNGDNVESSFIGKIQTYDKFFTHEQITFNVKVRTSYCQKANKYLVLFNISPKEFDSSVWRKLQKVKIDLDCDKR